MKIAILGGGLAGLTAGFLLKEKGYDFDLFEKDNKIGGLCRTVMPACRSGRPASAGRKDGFVFDVGGGHIIFSKDKEILNFMLSFFKKGEIVKNIRNTKIFYKERYIKYPFENGLSDLPKKDNYECLKGYIDAYIKRKFTTSSPKNFKEWLISHFGEGISQKYLIPYNEKIWNFKLENMDFQWIKDRIPDPPLEDIIKSSLGISTEGYKHQSLFYYPWEGGIQTLIEKIGEKIKERIKVATPVKSVEKDSKWLVNGIEYDKVISTIPIHELFKILNNVPDKVQKAVNNLIYNSLITFLVGLEQDMGDYSWVYFPGKKEVYNRVVYQSNYSPRNAPRGKSSLMVEMTYLKGKTVKIDEEFMQKNVVDSLERQGIIKGEKVCLLDWRKIEYAYVIYDLDYYKNVKLVYDYLDKMGIQTQGRFARFKYINMDQVIREVKGFIKENY